MGNVIMAVFAALIIAVVMYESAASLGNAARLLPAVNDNIQQLSSMIDRRIQW